MTIWFNEKDGSLHDDMDGAALSLSSWPQGMTEATAEQISAANQPSNAELWAAPQYEARAALSASDTTLMRCYEAGIPLPAEWVEYRKELRSIISSDKVDISISLPTRPAYPQGT